jgi:N-acetylglucosaminyldiphosphoundecaprenol N-acetyl-beta-D-mannosaminyltransferase
MDAHFLEPMPGVPQSRQLARLRSKVLQSMIDVIDEPAVVTQVLAWAANREHRTVSVCNVHSVVTARSDTALRNAVNNADLATPDGMPVAWLIGRRRGIRQPRVNGPDLMLALCQGAAARGIPVAFFGSGERTLMLMREQLLAQFPALRIALMLAPPYRPLSEEENLSYVRQLNESGAAVVFVGLGCPKQECWMNAHRAELAAVSIGVGAAFDYLAGTVRRPPPWMRRAGLEWLGRLLAEPGRLWRRYLVTNTVFLLYALPEFLGLLRRSGASPDGADDR